MNDQHPQDQTMATAIAAETTEPPLGLSSKVKGAFTDLSARQTFKLILLTLGIIVWYLVYTRLVPFSNWVTYDLVRILL